ncbi:MAG: hypothetical protein AAFN10_27855 [Bacteroidota bacterium]
MNLYYLIAGVLIILTGLVHSLLGERMIFKAKRKQGKIVPRIGSPGLDKASLGIVWATWHLASVLGWVLGAILIQLALIEAPINAVQTFSIQATALGVFLGSALVLVGTKAKHPGWIAMLIVGILLLLG